MIPIYTDIVWPFFYNLWLYNVTLGVAITVIFNMPYHFLTEHPFASFCASHFQSLLAFAALFCCIVGNWWFVWFLSFKIYFILPTTKTHLWWELYILRIYMYSYLFLEACILSTLAYCCSQTLSKHVLLLLRSMTKGDLKKDFCFK